MFLTGWVTKAVKRTNDGSYTMITSTDFLLMINDLRKTGTWYTAIETVEGKQIRLKGYKTWLQIYKVDGVDYSNLSDQSVIQFMLDILVPFQ